MNIRTINRTFLIWISAGLLASLIVDPNQQTAFGTLRFWLIQAPTFSFFLFNFNRLCELTGFLLASKR